MKTTANKLTNKTVEIKRGIEDFINENYKATDIVYDETAAKGITLFKDSMELIYLYCLYVKEQSDMLDAINSNLQTISERTNIILDNISLEKI